jgi:hypothetical protein
LAAARASSRGTCRTARGAASTARRRCSPPGPIDARFEDVEVESWDAPLLRLPTRHAERDFLVGKRVPPETAANAAQIVQTPLTVTKRGALVYGRKGSTQTT